MVSMTSRFVASPDLGANGEERLDEFKLIQKRATARPPSLCPPIYCLHSNKIQRSRHSPGKASCGASDNSKKRIVNLSLFFKMIFLESLQFLFQFISLLGVGRGVHLVLQNLASFFKLLEQNSAPLGSAFVTPKVVIHLWLSDSDSQCRSRAGSYRTASVPC